MTAKQFREREQIRKQHKEQLRRIMKRRSSPRRAKPVKPMAFADPQGKDYRRDLRLRIECRRRGYNEFDSYHRAFIRNLLAFAELFRCHCPPPPTLSTFC